MQLRDLFETFLKEKIYIKNTSPLTIKAFRLTYQRFTKCMGEVTIANITRESLKEFVIRLRELPIAPTTCNMSIREFNSFLTWLYENEYTPTHLKMKQLRVEKKVMKDFTDEEIKRLLDWKPKGFFQLRLYALICTLVDCGIRIDEALTLKRSNVDFDNLLIRVHGKGNKERLVPFSLELRKVLFKFLNRHQHSLVFCTRRGLKLSYHNVLREFKNLTADLGINNECIGFHQLRYGYALNFIRQGGDPFHLQRLMGHSSLTTTQGYVRLITEDLQAAHLQTSRLNRLKGS